MKTLQLTILTFQRKNTLYYTDLKAVVFCIHNTLAYIWCIVKTKKTEMAQI